MMHSSRGLDHTHYKLLFIVTLLLLAIVSVLYVMKRKEVTTVTRSLNEIKSEVDNTEAALNQKITEMQEKIESQTTLNKGVQSHLTSCEDEVTKLEKELETLELKLKTCTANATELRSSKVAAESQLKDVLSEKLHLETQVENLQIEQSSEKDKAGSCQQELSTCQTTLGGCSSNIDSLKAQVSRCLQLCPAAGGNSMLGDPLNRRAVHNPFPSKFLRKDPPPPSMNAGANLQLSSEDNQAKVPQTDDAVLMDEQ